MFAGFLLSLVLANAAVTGIVRDSTGGAVVGAEVVVRDDSGAEQRTMTGADGRFTFEHVVETGTLIIRAGGFAEKRQPIYGSSLDIVLSPAALLETVTVTPTRTEQLVGTTAASVSVLSAEQIQDSPALVADDVLRRIPTFSLFRRTSSLSSHPTAQGVSLRGVGPSGVSRTLVLLDGVPFNDPFGGWVYWTRVPMESAERIEVVDGSTSSLYGNYAMGGVINIISARPTRRTAEVRAQYGNLNSPKVDFFASDVMGKLGVALEGSMFDTDGYPIVAETDASIGEPGRGRVDTKATVDFVNFNLKADYTVNDRVSVFGRVGYFDEHRDNAKVSTINGDPEENATVWKHVQRRPARQPERRQRAAGADLHGLRNVPEQLPRRAGLDAAAQHRADDAQPARAHERCRHDGAVVACVRHQALLLIGDRLALGGWRQQRGRARCRERDERHPGEDLGRNAEDLRRLCSGHLHAAPEVDA